MKVKSESEVAQSCPTLSDPMDYSLLGSSVHGIFQAGVLEWGAIAFSEHKGLRSLFYSFLSPSARGCVGLSGSGTERREEIADGAGSHASWVQLQAGCFTG